MRVSWLEKSSTKISCLTHNSNYQSTCFEFNLFNWSEREKKNMIFFEEDFSKQICYGLKENNFSLFNM